MIKQIAILSAFCTIGCASERQLQKAETKLAQSGRLPKICADRFPARDSIVVKDSVTTDTLLLGEYIFDTIRVNDTIVVTKQIHLIKTKIRTQIVYRQDNAKADAIALQLEACNNDFADMSLGILETQKELDRYKKDAKTYFWWLWIVILLAIGWTFRKFMAKYVVGLTN